MNVENERASSTGGEICLSYYYYSLVCIIPIYPNKIDPIGLATKLTLKVKKTSNNPTNLFSVGKNDSDIEIANIPYKEKSYHSTIFPNDFFKKVNVFCFM